MSGRSKSIPVWGIALLVLGLLGVGIAGWFFWMDDFDFYHPPSTLQCAAFPKGQTANKASKKENQTLRFIAFGDYGQGTPFQAKLGEQMAKTYKERPYQLALLLGDNFYPNGDVKRVAKTHFEDPYHDLIANHVRFLAAIGDHDDHKGHVKDEMAYFHMPNDYYMAHEGPVDFFILNTTFFVRSPEQRQWIAKALAESKAPWKIVIGHHPLYSSGRNGGTKGTRKILEPLLIQHKVDLYLAGHDHDYERFSPIHGVQYIVSGGGGSYLYAFKKVAPQSQVRLKTHHFLLMETNATTLKIEAINRFGEVIDCLMLRKTAQHAASKS